MVKNVKKQSVIKPAELIIVDNDVDDVKCDGGIGSLGHPAVWYSFGGGDYVTCGYCGRGFVKKRSAKAYS